MSQWFSRASSFSWAVPTNLSVLKRPLLTNNKDCNWQRCNKHRIYSTTHTDKQVGQRSRSGFYPLWMISNLMPLDWMTRLKPRWARLMLSLNCSLNSGLLVLFTVLVLSLCASSYNQKYPHKWCHYSTVRYKQSERTIILTPSVTDSYRTGKRKLKLHTRIQIIRWDTWRQRCGRNRK